MTEPVSAEQPAHSPGRPASPRDWISTAVPILIILVTGIALLMRVWDLNLIPPGLWHDEAANGMDAQDLLRGQFRVFFPEPMGREPLYIYLTVPFIALWDGQPFAIRLAAAILGTLVVPVLYLAGRVLWQEDARTGMWAGLAAASFWAFNYWSLSINRIGFRASALPLVLTLAVLAWLRWSRAPTRRRSLVFGLLAGLTLTIYTAGLITPLLWLLLYLALPSLRRADLKQTLPRAILAFFLVLAPLVVHFVLHPQDAFTRLGTFEIVQTGESVLAAFRYLLENALQVAGVFAGLPGDPIARHNIPDRPPFSLLLAALFVAGLVLALYSLRRRSQRGWTLLLWWGLLCAPSVLAADVNPHFLRLFAALPPALLLAAWPIAWLSRSLRDRSRAARVAAALVLLLFVGWEAARTVRAYFSTWARETDLYADYQQGLWQIGERIASSPGTVGVVPLDPLYHDTLDYAFADAALLQVDVDDATIEQWLADHLQTSAATRVAAVVWHGGPYADADAQGAVPFYLEREGQRQAIEEYRDFDLITYELGPGSDFLSEGRRSGVPHAFSDELTLVEIRWGSTSSDTAVSAGATIWAILTWQVEQYRPELKVALDLVDEAGHRLDSGDSPLLGAPEVFETLWDPGTLVRTYHLLDIPSTQLPGLVALEVRAYDAQTLVPLQPESRTSRGSAVLATVSTVLQTGAQVVQPESVPQNVRHSFPQGIELLGVDPWQESLAPGQTLSLRLFWRVESPRASQDAIDVSLGDTGAATAVILPENLPVGQIVHTYADLVLPPDLASGAYALEVTSAGGEPRVLGQVNVAGRPRLFEAPDLPLPLAAQFDGTVALLGARAPAAISGTPGDEVSLTLYWRALRTAGRDLVRFVHLVDAGGHLVAQQDTVPCGGGCPARSWLPGEVLEDEVTLALPEELAPGSYSLMVGWYSPGDLRRLPALDSDDRRLADDLLLLPATVDVAP